MTRTASVTLQEIMELAPREAIRPRPAPYLGDTLTVSVASLPPEDLAVLRTLYEFLGALHDFCAARLARVPGDPAVLGELQAFLDRAGYADLNTGVTRLGAILRAEDTPVGMRKAYRDLRGGGLSSLVMRLDLVEIDRGELDDIERLFVLSRDHRAIMRNVLPELDEAGHRRDREPAPHAIELLRDKWSGTQFRDKGADARVVFQCDLTGSIAEHGVEMGALDRVLYNLVHNAARHTASQEVSLVAAALDGAAETQVRFAVINQVLSHVRDALLNRMGGDLGALFDGGFAIGGHGIGMSICGDIVSHGYGLSSIAEARERGYIGARIIRDCFVAWFHWPARRQS